MTNDGRTPLLYAAAGGHEVLRMLIDRNAKIHSIDNHGRTPLSHAAAEGKEAAANLLLASNLVTIDVSDEDGMAPLSLTAQCGHESLVTTLLRKHADSNAQSSNSLMPVPLAALNGPSQTVRRLLELSSTGTPQSHAQILTTGGRQFFISLRVMASCS